jgi:hypothetical protein
MTVSRIDLDWGCLLGFDHACRVDVDHGPVAAAKIGEKNQIASEAPAITSRLAAKIGSKDF